MIGQFWESLCPVAVHRGLYPGLLRGGFDPLPLRISDRRALASVTERYAVMQVCRQKPPAVLTGGIFELGEMGGFIASAGPAVRNGAV
ncbi:hypothetical protein T12_15170 [Trichinella patagoniensis]|uniref:Uncharacterized protein n=1 Tax=Trichinella patagoniensis TaxID=990121 RepID=A0A0V0Z2D2_9BILA|nr:hypothetical protein T12_15170 [Trichinella patagoniensis]